MQLDDHDLVLRVEFLQMAKFWVASNLKGILWADERSTGYVKASLS